MAKKNKARWLIKENKEETTEKTEALNSEVSNVSEKKKKEKVEKQPEQPIDDKDNKETSSARKEESKEIVTEQVSVTPKKDGSLYEVKIDASGKVIVRGGAHRKAKELLPLLDNNGQYIYRGSDGSIHIVYIGFPKEADELIEKAKGDG